MIKSLTKAQTDAMQFYVDKWTKIGLSTEPTNHERAIKNVKAYYEIANLKPPQQVIFAKSPLAAQIIANLINNKEFMTRIREILKSDNKTTPGSAVGSAVRSAVGSVVRSAVRSAVDSVVRSAVRSAVYSAVGSAVGSAVYSAVRSAVRSAVYSAVGSAVGSAVYSAVRSAVDSAVGSAVDSAVDSAVRSTVGSLKKLSWYNIDGGNLWSAWQAFYDFFDAELNVPGVDKIRSTLALSQDISWIIAFENVCILTEKPLEINIRNNRLHAEEKPSIKWADGYCLYSLNGVTMPEEVMSKPKDKISPQEILQLKNAEQRMQGMKYLGLGKFFDSLKTQVLDTKDGYQLLLIDHDGEMCEYLKMINPSTGEIHLEGIEPGLRTVDAALAWRNGLTYWINPLQLT